MTVNTPEMHYSSKPSTAGLRSRKEEAAPPGPWGKRQRNGTNMVQSSLRMERVGQEGREGREESVCEQQSTIIARVGKHTWRRGCVERERLVKMVRKCNRERERKGGCGRERKMLLPGNCSELGTSIVSSAGEDKNNGSAKWTEHQGRHKSWSWAGSVRREPKRR